MVENSIRREIEIDHFCIMMEFSHGLFQSRLKLLKGSIYHFIQDFQTFIVKLWISE